MSADHRLLLKEATLLYEKYEAERPQPFSVFSVLRSESDEVNLHSRFLHALLNYRNPGDETRENLTDFLRYVGLASFELLEVKLEQEQHNIDILITNKAGQAIVVENKIWAGDRDRQLLRYHRKMKNLGYSEVSLLYLTLDGRDPSKNSVGNLTHVPVSYKYDLLPWLERCQKRAYNEPGLRESIAQYRQLVRKLTGTDLGRTYMNGLKELCLQDNNLVLIQDLYEAMIEVKVALLKRLWCEINTELKVVPGIAQLRTDHQISEEKIKRFFTNQRDTYHGLFYQFCDEASLQVGVGAGDGRIYYGVACSEDSKRYEQVTKATRNLRFKSLKPDRTTPWYRYANGLKLRSTDRQELGKLSNEETRKAHAEEIAKGLKPVWEAVRKYRPLRSV